MAMPGMSDFELSAAEFRALYDRVTFFCVIAPLRLSGGTGSPINPIAIF
jgi:hypothetical protein